MGCRFGAKNVKVNVPNTNGKATESIFGMKIVIGLSRESGKSYAPSAAYGKLRASFTRIFQVEMA